MDTQIDDENYSGIERVVKDVPCPPSRPLESEKLWGGPGGKPDIDLLKDWFFREGRLSPEDVVRLCEEAATLLETEPNLLSVEGSVTVCGDIHGQFYDLIKLFEIGGDPRSTIYLFMGDYVDRGHFGLECTLLLFAHKICFPNNFFLLRGNHECRHLTAYFNFKEEILYKYDETIYDTIMEAFDTLPLAAVVNNKFFAVHGGLSPEIKSLEQINKDIDRFQEPPPQGNMCDLLWSDPIEDESEESVGIQFVPNTTRGCSFFFGHGAVKEFLERNQLLSVLRAHEAQLDGYKMHRKRTGTDFPSVITLFSAPNYCNHYPAPFSPPIRIIISPLFITLPCPYFVERDSPCLSPPSPTFDSTLLRLDLYAGDIYANKGAILKYHDNLMNIRQFNCSPHPYHLPQFMNVFQWSLPFVADKVAEFCLSIVNSVSAEEDDEEDMRLALARGKAANGSKTGSGKGAAMAGAGVDTTLIKNKIKAAAKFSMMLKQLRDNSDEILRIKKEMPGGTLPAGLLTKGSAEIRRVIDSFDKAKKVDMLNERRPSQEDIVAHMGPRSRRLSLQKGEMQEALRLASINES